jgi:hypothetical protein
MTTHTDNFNRANETPLAAPWSTCFGGGARLVSNAITSVANTESGSYYFDTWGADQESMATVGNLSPNTNYAELLVRADGSGNAFGLVTDGQSGAGHTEFARWNAGTYTALGGVATTFANGDKMRLTVSGSSGSITLTAYKDTGGGWVQVGQITGQTGPNSGAPGVAAYGLATIDDWTGTDGAASTTLDQKVYRYFNDDGSESGSTAMAGQNVDVTVSPGGVFRIRFGIQATGDPTGKQFRLEYDTVGGSNWKQVP